MRHLIFLPLVAGLAACAQTPAQVAATAQAQQATQDRLAGALAGLTPGASTSCLPLAVTGSNAQIKGYGDTILYRIGRDRIYRNDTTGGCEGIGTRDDILVTVSPQGRACQGDIARTVDRSSQFTTGSCGLGEFVEYRRRR